MAAGETAGGVGGQPVRAIPTVRSVGDLLRASEAETGWPEIVFPVVFPEKGGADVE